MECEKAVFRGYAEFVAFLKVFISPLLFIFHILLLDLSCMDWADFNRPSVLLLFYRLFFIAFFVAFLSGLLKIRFYTVLTIKTFFHAVADYWSILSTFFSRNALKIFTFYELPSLFLQNFNSPFFCAFFCVIFNARYIMYGSDSKTNWKISKKRIKKALKKRIKNL